MILLLSCNPLPDTLSIEDIVANQDISPVWTEEEVFAHYDELIKNLPNASTILDWYRELYDDGATAQCPGTNYNFDSPDSSTYGCETMNGYFFSGAAELRYMAEDDWDFHCDCRIVASDGRAFQGAGNIGLRASPDNSQMEIVGSFWAEPHEEWLENTGSATLQFRKIGDNFELNGGYSLLGDAVYFPNLRQSSCPAGEGDVYIRDPSGLWWWWELQPNCKQALFFQNERIAKVFHDNSALWSKMEVLLP